MNNTKNEVRLTKRLLAAAGYVRNGGRVADIGTDHAYLPIYLVQHGIVQTAVASDVRESPIMRAEKNVSAHGFSDRIICRLADGLDGIAGYRPTDIVICGMGGELIASILAASEYVKNSDVRLVLQPMTMAHKLRAYLAENGFEIIGEDLVIEHDDKLYQLIAAVYREKAAVLDDTELYLGPLNIKNRHPLLPRLAGQTLSALDARINGLSLAGRVSPEDEKLRQKIVTIMGGYDGDHRS